MTSKTLTLRSTDIPHIHKFAIGFDSVFDELFRLDSKQSDNYPPYNIIKYDEDNFAIELAVAGFHDGDIELVVEKNILTISGERPYITESETAPIYLHQGIGYRKFVRSFTLAEHAQVKSANSENGIITIKLERNIPEEQKPKTIAITHHK